jgi:cytochrome o ubiquinol oxidase subunit 2
MNVFFIPRLGTQIYAMAGMQTQLHLLAKNPGSYSGISANFSGPGFADMRFSADAVSRKTFENWVKQTQSNPTVLDMAAFSELERQN